MSVATPKTQASEPIQLDVLLVCRKRANDSRVTPVVALALEQAAVCSRERCSRLIAAGFNLSRHDQLAVRGARLLVALGPLNGEPTGGWRAVFASLENSIDSNTDLALSAVKPVHSADSVQQAELFASPL